MSAAVTAHFREPARPRFHKVKIRTKERRWEWLVQSRAENMRYRITEVPDLFGTPSLAALAPVQHVIFDKGAGVWEPALRAYLAAHGVSYTWYDVSGGESCKTQSEADRLVRALVTVVNRRDLVVAIGGGATLDLARFVASRVLKGLPLALVPTTGTAAVDTAVGVKGAVNVEGVKNGDGFYYPPAAVLLNRGLLSTTSQECAAAGLMELLKMGVITGGRLFSRLEAFGHDIVTSRYQCDVALPVMRDGITATVRRLAPNLTEFVLTRELDLAHGLTALERLAGLLHGIAVGVDLGLTAAYSHCLGKLSDASMRRIHAVIARDALLYHPLVTVDLVSEALARTAQLRDGVANFPVIHEIGRVVVHRHVVAAAMADAVALLSSLAQPA